ncbi:hypothetical protein F4775DRAFT_599613 [Biscogniauxia sp. FL1348]|nr:hypothetical protein F4775DRAFT_599613 [Biscogniauxia sp. FL1348]
MPTTEIQGFSNKMEEMKSKVSRVVRAFWLRNDPVFILFHKLPSSELVCLVGTSKSVSDAYNCAFEDFCQTVMRTSKSKDSDFDFLRLLFVAWERRPVVVGFPDHIAALALKKEISLKDKSTKGQHLRYHLWMAKGRKDESWPLNSENMVRSGLNSVVVSHAHLPEDPDTYLCANCGDDPTITVCKRCRIKGNGLVVSATGYCTVDCQDTHWARHKARCDQISRLNRAAEIFCEIFEYYSKACYTLNIRKVSTKDGIVTAELDDMDALAYQGKHLLWEFPTSRAASQEEAKAVMYTETGKDVFTVAKPLLELLMRTPKYKLEKLVFRPKNCHLAVDFKANAFHSFNTLRSHEVILITIPSTHKAVFDPACAKFGWDEYLAPWDRYKAQRIARVHKITPIKPDKDFNVDKYFNEQSSPVYGAHLAKASVMARVTSEVELVANQQGGLEKVLSNLTSITKPREKIIAAAKWAIDSRVAALRRDLKYKLFFDYNFRLYATRNSATYNLMNSVWFTESEYLVLQDEPLILREKWQERLKAVIDPIDPQQFRVENIIDCKTKSSKDPDSEPEEDDMPESESPHPVLPPGVKYGSPAHALLCLEGKL